MLSYLWEHQDNQVGIRLTTSQGTQQRRQKTASYLFLSLRPPPPTQAGDQFSTTVFYGNTGVLSHFSHVRLFATPWTVAHQALLSLGFSRQEHWSGLPCPPPGDLPNPGIEAASLMSPALAGGFFTTSATWEVLMVYKYPSIVRCSIINIHTTNRATSVAQTVKSLPAMWETRVRSLDWEGPLEKKMATPIFLPRKSNGWRSMAGYIVHGVAELDMTEQLTFSFFKKEKSLLIKVWENSQKPPIIRQSWFQRC